MSVFAITRKSINEIARDRVGLSLTLLTAPFFVVFYALMFNGVDAPLRIAVSDQGAALALERAGLESVAVDDVGRSVEDGVTDLGIVAVKDGFEIVGDATSPRFVSGLPAVQMALVAYTEGHVPPVRIASLGQSGTRTPFELYVPNLVVFAVIMLVFSSAMAIAREVERGTLERMRLTLSRPWQFLLGVTLSQACLGVVAVTLTYLIAVLLGFVPAGSDLLFLLVAIIASVACIAMGGAVGGFARNVLQAFLMASVVMFLLVLFSGLVFPIPEWTVSTGVFEVEVFAVLPTVHAVSALSRISNLGVGFAQVWPSIASMALLALAFFTVGWLRFSRSQKNFLQESS